MSCPLEGVQTLTCTADDIVAAAHAARRVSRDEGVDSRPAHAGAISSDDLLPLFIAALVQVSVHPPILVQTRPCQHIA